MTTNKKLVVTVGVMAVALVLALTGIIVVLVTANQRASSAVNVKYTSSDVAVTLSATAYLGSNSYVFTKGGVVGGETELVLSPTVTEGSLSQTNDIASFDLSKTNDYVVFEYVFANNTDTIDVRIDQDSIPATKENINLTYTYSDTPIQYYSFKTLEGETEFTAQLLPAYANEETVKYVYIKAQIADLLYDSSLVGDFGWALSKPNEADVNTVTLSVADADYIERTGSNLTTTEITSDYTYRTFDSTVDVEDISIVPAVVNKAFIGWSETEGGTVISTIDMPNADETHNALRGTTAKTLYPVYIDGNVNMTTTATGASVSYSQGVTEAIIPDITTHEGSVVKVTSIGSEAFKNSGLTSIRISNNVTSIGNMAFQYCRGLTSITISDGVTSIGGMAFSGCTGLTSVIIGRGLTSMGGLSLSESTVLTSVVVKNGHPALDSRDNCNAIIETATNTLIWGCSISTIPNSVTSIGESAFNGCMGLTNITIPNSVTSIGDYAFLGCALTEITISSSVTSIGERVFFSCTGLLESNGGSGITFEDTNGWRSSGLAIDVSNPQTNATNFVSGSWIYAGINKIK